MRIHGLMSSQYDKGPAMVKRALECYDGGNKRHKAVVRHVDWTRLPLEVIAYILSFDDDVHRPMAGLTCKAFQNASLVFTDSAEMKCHDAASYGWLSALRWPREHGCPWDEQTCSEAAAGGHLEVLRWAREQRRPCRWYVWTCTNAALFDHFDVLQWARGQSPPCPWDNTTCLRAAANGNLEMLKWVREHGCPWHSDVCVLAAREGNLEMLQWARAQPQPCPWDYRVCRVATICGHTEILHWAKENGCDHFESY